MRNFGRACGEGRYKKYLMKAIRLCVPLNGSDNWNSWGKHLAVAEMMDSLEDDAVVRRACYEWKNGIIYDIIFYFVNYMLY